ncbi:hypothetical protein RN001_001532 [Aquatica leii]|uniref:CCHC-type domain-containing protein n=1 Tax=Aquatica leii TaxID=1421715 RepID=A0AAN7PNP3_9COLE|nr:hypothetical protein RN001_001532 [Aquatica leii]
MASNAVQTFTVDTFDPASTTWSRWVKRLEGAFKVFKTEEEIKVFCILHYMGANTYDILCDKLAPIEPETKSYKEIVELLQNFYSPAPLEIAEIFRFQSRKQWETESIQEYCHALQKLSINCKFGAYLNNAVRNQFVFGLQSKRIQARLLETKDLTLEKALELASSMDITEKDVKELHGEPNSVHAVTTTRRKPQFTHKSDHTASGPQGKKLHGRNGYNRYKAINNTTFSCFRCGGSHLATKCTLDRNTLCSSCGVKGHLRKVCMKNKQVNNVEEILQIKSEDTEYRAKYKIILQVENEEINFEVDSGSAVTLIDRFNLLYWMKRYSKRDMF